MRLCEAQGTTDHHQRWHCIRQADHLGDHMDDHGRSHRRPGDVLRELAGRWGRTHRFAYTGTLWVATHRSARTHWRTEIEPTSELLEARLRAHHGPPPGPAPHPPVVPEPRRGT
ncbi:hypothetical protein [Nocardiopsis oceani]